MKGETIECRKCGETCIQERPGRRQCRPCLRIQENGRNRVRNPDDIRVIHKRWRQNNRHKIAALDSKRRRLKRASDDVPTLTADEWREILEAFNHACAYCLRDDAPMTLDHVEPLATNGEHSAENIVPACARCNASKRDRRIWSMLNR